MNFHVSISEKELIKINFVLFGKINIQTEIEPDFWYQFNGIQVAAFFFFNFKRIFQNIKHEQTFHSTGSKLVLLMASYSILIPSYEQMQLSCKSFNRVWCQANILIGIRKCPISMPEEQEIFGIMWKARVFIFNQRPLLLHGYREYKPLHLLLRAIRQYL